MTPSTLAEDRTSSLPPSPPEGLGPRPILLQALLTVGVAFTISALASGTGEPQSVKALAWAANILILLQTAILRRSAGSLTAPIVLFSTLLALFTTGQLTLYAFGLPLNPADVLAREDFHHIERATVFFCFAYLAFGFGVIFSHAPRKTGTLQRTQDADRTIRPNEWQEALSAVGALCLAVGAIPFALRIINNLRIVWTSGYSSYYREGARIDSPLLGLSYFFIAGLILISCSGKRRSRRWAIGVFVTLAAIRLASGDRGEGMIYLLTAYLILDLLGERARRRRILPILIGGFFVVAVPVIGAFRQSFSLQETSVVSLLTDQNPIFSTLNTLGATLYPLVKVMELVPGSQAHTGGSSYLASLFLLLPAPLRVGSVEQLTSDPISASPANWLMTTSGLSYGPGFTPFAEGYLNFGFSGGCLTLLAYGFLYGKLLRLPEWGSPTFSVRMALALASFALVGFSVRGSFNFTIPFIVRYVAFPLLLVFLVAASASRRRIAAERRRPR